MATQPESRLFLRFGRPTAATPAQVKLGLVAVIGLITSLNLAGAQAETRGLLGIRLAALAHSEASSAAAARPALASGVNLINSTDQATLTFDLDAPVSATAFALLAPDRVVVDLPQVDFRIDPQVGMQKPAHQRPGRGRAPDLIISFRFGLLAPGKSRIVIDLGAPVRVVRAASESAGRGSRLVIQLAKTKRAAFEAAARAAEPATGVSPAQPDRPPAPLGQEADKNGLPLIVIDPGHGGIDSGAIVKGLVEKNIVFDFAKRLQSKLQASGHYKIIMTRDSDVFLALGDRVRIARDSGAALFVSIHADTISDAASVSGATVYTVSDHASDAEAARTAEKENQADAKAGVEGDDETNGVNDILFDLTRQETRAFSHVFARTLVNYWKVAGRLNKNPERAAGFRVLKAPDVPSVLIELGYLSNKQDAVALSSADWRDSTSAKVAKAIDAFFAARGQHFETTGAATTSVGTTALEAPTASAEAK